MLIPNLLLLLCLPAAQLPGHTYSSPTAPLALHAGPSPGSLGVLELEAGAVLRVGLERGAFSEVFVPQGFPVYLHGGYVSVDRSRRTVTATGARVNVRLLPSTVGSVPVGQVGPEDGELVLLDEEGAWVRVLAPLGLPLYAPTEALPSASGGGVEDSWRAEQRTRDLRRHRDANALELSAPGFLDDLRVQHEVEFLGRTELTRQDDVSLGRILSEASSLAERASSDLTRSAAQALAASVTAEQHRRSAAVQAASDQRARAQVAAADALREARSLATGLRFLGKGDEVTITGLVSRLATTDTELSIYSISDGQGRLYKLTAAADVVDLTTLADRTATVRGRTLALVNVSGPVLIVDQVSDIRR